MRFSFVENCRSILRLSEDSYFLLVSLDMLDQTGHGAPLGLKILKLFNRVQDC